MKKYLIFALLFCLAISFCLVSSEVQTLPDIKQGDCVELTQSHPNATSINVTSIRFPNRTIDSAIKKMSTGNNFDYNYTFCNTLLTGEYIVQTCGNGDGVLDCPPPYNFFVTPTGITQESIWNNPLLIIMVLISVILLVLAIYISNPPLGFISGILFSLTGVYTMIYGLNNYTDMYTRSVALVLIALGAIFMIASGYEWLKGAQDENSVFAPEGGSSEED